MTEPQPAVLTTSPYPPHECVIKQYLLYYKLKIYEFNFPKLNWCLLKGKRDDNKIIFLNYSSILNYIQVINQFLFMLFTKERLVETASKFNVEAVSPEKKMGIITA